MIGLERATDRFREVLTRPSFRRWAAAFPLTRPIARRRARALFDLCAGFVYSQVLAACVELRVFEILAEGPQSADDLSKRLMLPMPSTERLLNAAVALRLAARRKRGRFALGPLGAALVNNEAVVSMIEHQALLYADLKDPVALLRRPNTSSALSGYWAYVRDGGGPSPEADRIAGYSALMSASQPLVADEILSAYSLRRHRRLLDVGGGEGTFLAHVARRLPTLQLMLFDLPPVVERARARLAPIGERLEIHGGNFFTDPLPMGADVISLIRVVHDHDDAAVLTLLRNGYRALGPGGVILIAEPMSRTSGAEPVGDAYFGFYLFAMGSGRPRTPAEIASLLKTAGFSAPRLLNTNLPLQTRVIVARAGPR